MSLLDSLIKKKGPVGDPVATPETEALKKGPRQTIKPGVSDYLAGEAKSFARSLSPHLPSDLIGGSVPYVPGTEEEAVWNAASQACSTERVHFAYTVEDNRCWYLACPSSSLASNPDSWCPLSAALPGNSEHWDRETVYLYEQEGLASAMRWDPETGRMQVFIGASRTLLPRIQSMDANFVTINPEMADVVPWRNRALKSEKLSRATAKILLLSGLFVNLIAITVLIFAYVNINVIERDLRGVKRDTENASSTLMLNAANALQSDTIKHMVRVQSLLDTLGPIEGTLVKYEVDRGKVSWEALVPKSFSNLPQLNGKIVPSLEPDGRVRVQGTR